MALIPAVYCCTLMTPQAGALNGEECGPPLPGFVRVGQAGPPQTRMRTILEWPDFPVHLVAGETGLDRVVRVPHATEMEDPSLFLRGGELIMTVGSELSDAAACERFVANIMRGGAAGLALAVGVPSYTPPPWLAPAAETVGLPMITVPPTLPFVQFTEKFQQLADERHEYERRRRETGRMLDFLRRGFASAQVFGDAFPWDLQLHYDALCLPRDALTEIEGVVLEGWVDDVCVVISEHRFIEKFAERTDLSIYGVGSPVFFSNLGRSLKEAFAALAVSSRRNQPAGPRDLSTLSGLIERLSTEQFRPFNDHIIQPLKRYDAKYGRSLLPTLVAYVEADASVATTAKNLGIHANSVHNRLGRIAELTGLDLHSMDGQFSLVLAVRGHEALRASHRGPR